MNCTKEELITALENEIIIAQRKKDHFARMVSLDLLTGIHALLKQEDEGIAKTEAMMPKKIPSAMDDETLRNDAVKLLRTECIGDSEFMELAKQMGADALALQITKRIEKTFLPLFNDIPVYVGDCPSCKARQTFVKLPFIKTDVSRCNICGQALDWSEVK